MANSAVSREGFCCSLTRKALFYITSDAFFGTAKTCIINTKWSEGFETFHTTKCIMQLHQTSKSCAFSHLVQVGIEAGV